MKFTFISKKNVRYDNYIGHKIQLIMFFTLHKKNSIKNVLKWLFSGFSFFFIAMLFFVVVHDAFTGSSSQTAEYCAKYGFLASPECW